MKRYLVTGAAGFIGSHLAEYLLRENNKVINIDNFNDYYDLELKINNVLSSTNNKDKYISLNSEKYKILNDLKSKVESDRYKLEIIDIRNMELLEQVFRENEIDMVIHIAARAGVRPSIEEPILYQEVNCGGTQNILECCRKYNVKNFIGASSSSVYGNNKEVPFKETDIVDFAISPYAATKKANEVMGHVYHKLYNINISFLRFFTVYGPRQRPDLAINKFTKLILEDKEIPVYGDGTTSRDYTYIDDIVDGIIRVIEYLTKNKNVYEVFNIGSSKPISLKEMIGVIEKVVGKKAKVKKMKMQPGDVNRTYADISKLKNATGYIPETSFENGIIKFINWKKNKL